jgi:hypothetical protein
MTEGPKPQDYRGTWKDWPFIAAGVAALIVIALSTSGGETNPWHVVLIVGLVLTGLIRGGTFSSRR